MISSAIDAGWDIAPKDDDSADAAHLANIANAMHSFRSMNLSRKQIEVLNVLGVKLK